MFMFVLVVFSLGCRRFYLVVFGERLCFCGVFFGWHFANLGLGACEWFLIALLVGLVSYL
jgi:hypothetical protein